MMNRMPGMIHPRVKIEKKYILDYSTSDTEDTTDDESEYEPEDEPQDEPEDDQFNDMVNDSNDNSSDASSDVSTEDLSDKGKKKRLFEMIDDINETEGKYTTYVHLNVQLSQKF